MGRSALSFREIAMRWIVVSTVGLLVSSASIAQDQPRSVTTQKVRMPLASDTQLYRVEPDGAVRIDWDAVEALAASKADRTLSPVAELMLAIRDRKWIPMR